jgi:hypothetical protein
MKKEFAAYYRPSDKEFKRLWTEGWFVLDANILLNLYRFQEQARGDFLRVLKTLAPRLWVPHQSVSEYQRNRVKTIRDQLKRFGKLRELVSLQALQSSLEQHNQSLRSLIDPAHFLDAVRPHYEAFEKQVATLEAKQITVESTESDDPVRTELDGLLLERVGPAFTQAALDALHEEGERRYEMHTPPGYIDPKKKSDHSYQWADRTYKSKFGDWILWKQILNWAHEGKIENVVFVTDDRTEDWWQIADEPGEPKRRTPRPELVAEIKEVAAVKLFYMYPADRFLDRAVAELNLEVPMSSIREVREVAERESARDATIIFKSSSWGLLDTVCLGASVNGIDTLVLVADDVFVDWFGVRSNAPAVLLAALEENRGVVEEVARQAIRDGRINAGGMGWLTSPDFSPRDE